MMVHRNTYHLSQVEKQKLTEEFLGSFKEITIRFKYGENKIHTSFDLFLNFIL